MKQHRLRFMIQDFQKNTKPKKLKNSSKYQPQIGSGESTTSS